jgi:hypothetical protein
MDLGRKKWAQTDQDQFLLRILTGKECSLSAIANGCKLKIEAFCSL